MSGTPPYAYLETSGGNLVALGVNALQYVFDDLSFSVVIVEGQELFQPGCFTANFLDTSRSVEHPIGAYNISYPYCRTALQYNMADTRADPQIGQVILAAPFISIKIILVGCDQSAIKSVTTKIEPAQSDGCGLELYPGNVSTELFLIGELAALTLPARISFTITNVNNKQNSFWIGIRKSRSALPSGAVV